MASWKHLRIGMLCRTLNVQDSTFGGSRRTDFRARLALVDVLAFVLEKKVRELSKLFAYDDSCINSAHANTETI